jgi:hypothetical protein
VVSNLTSVNKTIRTLALDDEHAGLVALVRSLAKAVDADPCGDCKAAQDAAIYREYRQALADLERAGSGATNDDDADFLVSIRTPRRAAVGDAAQP